MTEELKNYLEKSRESRKKLTNIAKSVQKSSESQGLKADSKNFGFPEINPKGFHNFEVAVQQNLKKFFIPEEIHEKSSINQRSFSYYQQRINSVYNLVKPSPKRMSFLPPVVRFKSSNVPERILGGKYLDVSNSDTTPTSHISFSPKKPKQNTRFEVKKQLLEPILKRNRSKESYYHKLHKGKSTD